MSSSPRCSTERGGLRRLAAALVGVAAVVTTVVALGHLRDDVAATLRVVGEGGRALVGAGSGRRRLWVNGVAVTAVVRHHARSLEAHLDAVEADCAAGAFGDPAPWWARVVGGPALRSERDGAAVIGCLRPERPWSSLQGLAADLAGAAGAGEHRRAGVATLSWVERAEGGVSELRLELSAPLELAGRFSAEGDAPGGDPVPLPRPPESRRVLVAEPEDAGPALAAYESPWPAARVLAWYRRALERRGDSVTTAARAEGVATLFARRGGSQAIVAVEGGPGATMVALVRLHEPARGGVVVTATQ